MAQKFPSLDAISAAIDAWFAEYLQQPPISHSVESYNQAHGARAELKRRLGVLITGEEPLVLEPEMQVSAQEAPEPEADLPAEDAETKA